MAESPLGPTRRRLGRAKRDAIPAIAAILRRGGQRFVSKVTKENLSGPTSPSSLSVRSGALRRALRSEVTADAASARLVVFFTSGVPYARIHEFGGVITPKKAGALAIPTRRMLTAAGVARVASPRQVANLFVIRKLGQAFLARSTATKTGKAGKKSAGGGFSGARAGRGVIEILFRLVPMVRMPARMGFRRAWRAFVPELRREVQAALKKLV